MVPFSIIFVGEFCVTIYIFYPLLTVSNSVHNLWTLFFCISKYDYYLCKVFYVSELYVVPKMTNKDIKNYNNLTISDLYNTSLFWNEEEY